MLTSESEHSCSCTKTADALARKQGRVLRIILGLNLVMFFIEGGAGMFARSSALLGDSLDMLGDALAYGATLFVLGKGPAWTARATVLKGAMMGLTAVGVLVVAGLRLVEARAPGFEAMTGIGLLALAVNTGCLVLLTRHRSDDMNLSSAWACSRNDLIANAAVIAAGGIVAFTGTHWPDFVVGVGIALLFASSAVNALRAGLRSASALVTNRA